MKIGAIIQGRSTSTRLPRKVLKHLPYDSNITVLEQVIRRLKKSKKVDEVILATTINESDDELVNIAKKENIPFFRGSESNVLERYYKSALENELDLVIRITSDCPCIDFNIVDDVIDSHLETKADYTSISLVETYPRGIDVEVINFNILEKAYNEASEQYELEHVTPFIYKSHPDLFKINLYSISGEDNSDIRITLDTYKDYALLCAIYDELFYSNNFFTLDEILNLFKEKPWLKLINKDVSQKKIFNNLEEELEELIKLADMQDLDRSKKFLENHLKNSE